MFHRFFDHEFSDKEIVLAAGGLSLVIAGADIVLSGQYAISVLYISVVLLSLRHNKREKASCYLATLSSLLIVFVFFVSDSGDFGTASFVNRGLGLLAIWSVAWLCVKLEEMDQKNEQALLEAKRFELLLPVCSSCGSIREDEGYWNTIQRHIESRSEVDLAKGVCPECQEILYPEAEDVID